MFLMNQQIMHHLPIVTSTITDYIVSEFYFRTFIMKNLPQDIVTSLVLLAGVIGFINGEFIISSALFAASTYTSNIHINRKQKSP